MKSLRRLWPYVRRHSREYAVGLVSAVLTSLFALWLPRVLQQGIDDLGHAITRQKLFFYGVELVALAFCGGVFRFLMRRLVIGACRSIEYEVRNDFFAHLQRLTVPVLQSRRTGDLISRATNDLENVRLMIGISVIDAANTLMVFVVAVAFMFAIDRRLTLIALIPLPFVSLTVNRFGKAIHRRYQQVQAELAEVTAVVQEALAGVRVIKAYGQETAQVERFREATRRYFGRNRNVIRLQSAFYGVMSFCLGTGSLLVLWLGIREVMGGRMSLGQFVAFSAYQVMLGLPMVAFGSVTNTVQRGVASWGRMCEVFDLPEIDQGGARLPRTSIRGAIEFRDLTFSYGRTPVLDRVSLSIAPGQTVGIVGPTGSGKSTLLGLLPRLQEPPRGTVFLDGIDVRDLPLPVLRVAIGFVPQEPFLFSDTVARNSAFGSRDLASEVEALLGGVDLRGAGAHHTMPDLIGAIKRAGAIARLDKDLDDMPQGYQTPLGERGLTLSGGQRQRTALARALMIDPRVLILDDPLSAVDARTEEEILARLADDVFRKHTTIIVSNRISTVRRADLIVVLDDGRIVERGRHEDLVARNGLYAQMYRKQLLKEALAAS